jgi:hypothetical protein
MVEVMVRYVQVEMPLQGLMEVAAAQDIMAVALEDSMKSIAVVEVVHPILEILHQSLRSILLIDVQLQTQPLLIIRAVPQMVEAMVMLEAMALLLFYDKNNTSL